MLSKATDSEEKPLKRLIFRDANGEERDYVPPSTKEELAYYMELLFGVKVASQSV